MKTSMTTLSQIHTALERITTIPEAKDLRDKAAALVRYVKERHQSLHIQNQACFVKLLCERKAGALLLEMPRKQGRKGEVGLLATLARSDVNIPETTARRWQYLAQWPEKELLQLLEACNEDEEEMTTLFAINAARAYLDSQKAKAKKQQERQEEELEGQEQEEEVEEPHRDEEEEAGSGEQEEEAGSEEQEEEPSGSERVMWIEPERAERLYQLLDAACDLCKGNARIKSWIPTIRKWQSKLDDLSFR